MDMDNRGDTLGTLDQNQSQPKGSGMSIWVILLIIVGWVVLQAYILPKFGIST